MQYSCREMKNVFSLSVISTKLVFLACFSLMGSFSFSSAVAEVIPPCHQMAMEQESKEPVKDCLACDISEKGWDQPFVTSPLLDVQKISELPVVIEHWHTFTPEITNEVRVSSVPDPPDKISVLHAELVVKNSTVFVI